MHRENFTKKETNHNVYYQDATIGSCLVSNSNKKKVFIIVNSPKNVKEVNNGR